MRARRFATVLAILVVAAGVSGCGSDDDSEDEGLTGRDREVAEALADEMGRNLRTESGRVASECTANAIVERLGGDRVVDAGLLSDDLKTPEKRLDHYPRDVAEAVADAYVACWDVDAAVADARLSSPGASEQGLQDYEDCLLAIPDSVIRDSFLNLTIKDGDAEKRAAFGTAIAKCQEHLR